MSEAEKVKTSENRTEIEETAITTKHFMIPSLFSHKNIGLISRKTIDYACSGAATNLKVGGEAP